MKITKAIERLAYAIEQNTLATFESMALNEQLARTRIQLDKDSIAAQQGMLAAYKAVNNVKSDPQD